MTISVRQSETSAVSRTLPATQPGSGEATAPHVIDTVARTSTAPVDEQQWRDAIDRIQQNVNRDLALQTTPGSDGLYLRPHTESLFLHTPTPDARGTVIIYHGYTAAPWQCPEIAQRFLNAGYNVYAPRMPGHGFTLPDGTPTGKRIPRSTQDARWEDFINTTVSEAKALGAPISVVGLSGGADLALRAAESHPSDVARTVCMSPYLGGNLPKGILFPAVNFLDRFTFGLLGRLLDHVPYEGNPRVPNDPMPHTRGSIGQAMMMCQVGRDVKRVTVPTQFLQTAGDRLSGTWEVGHLIRRSSKAIPIGWYRFHTDQHVPHAMMSPLENTSPGAAQTVSDITFNFIVNGQTANRT